LRARSFRTFSENGDASYWWRISSAMRLPFAGTAGRVKVRLTDG
jgi:hypothetical protein